MAKIERDCYDIIRDAYLNDRDDIKIVDSFIFTDLFNYFTKDQLEGFAKHVLEERGLIDYE
jgi:hypothetical protein